MRVFHDTHVISVASRRCDKEMGLAGPVLLPQTLAGKHISCRAVWSGLHYKNSSDWVIAILISRYRWTSIQAINPLEWSNLDAKKLHSNGHLLEGSYTH